ncbi:hypothetical protein KIN20_033780, partial [Parelaphostrongylus tenuis]
AFKLGNSQDPETDDTYGSHGYGVKIDECNSGSIMGYEQRIFFVNQHNGKRSELQEGKTQNGPEESSKFQSAKDMIYMGYDCNLEKTAYRISQMCNETNDNSFDNVKYNKATIPLSNTNDVDAIFDLNSDANVEFFIEEISRAIDDWWSTSKLSKLSADLKPTPDNSPMIPFLRMANAGTLKLGCAYSRCTSNPNSPFVSLVCQYGKKYVT